MTSENKLLEVVSDGKGGYNIYVGTENGSILICSRDNKGDAYQVALNVANATIRSLTQYQDTAEKWLEPMRQVWDDFDMDIYDE